ncbi:glycosyltransferase family 2 protein [Halomicronema hongdechloris]|uniref:glycosyltransferase family 2 protein n=1 Tax=Halomicronema hongdechloris TaxID=1209493 RepID=UPI001CED0373|nr:glycosyltransferase family 2 protein [Halomicronema hongdechloris]
MTATQLASVLVVIPVCNEASTIAGVIQALHRLGLRQVRVVDNGSSDDSAAVAAASGAEVWQDPITGYGQACWRGIQQLPESVQWIVFCDGDGSDDLEALPGLLARRERYDLILGDRTATAPGRAALSPAQRWGNRLATTLIRLGWGYRYRDLGPLRVIRRLALDTLHLRDRGFGWTVEMQVRAVECGLAICEVPVAYHQRQGGRSKISGTVVGSLQAGAVILGTLGRLYWHRWVKAMGFGRSQ